jgi:hypothetical protein
MLDADICPQPWWLAALVAPLATDGADLVNGYRWARAEAAYSGLGARCLNRSRTGRPATACGCRNSVGWLAGADAGGARNSRLGQNPRPRGGRRRSDR